MTLTCYQCIDGVNATTQHSRGSAFCGAVLYLAKRRVFPGFRSCNGHVTTITYGAELITLGGDL